MDVIQNTLYVLTQGMYLRRDHQTIRIESDGKTHLSLPIHNIEAIALFGHIMFTPGVLDLCANQGVPITFLKESGRLIARVDAPVSGNVLLRREQFRKADSSQATVQIARNIVAGKIQNTRALLLRTGRESRDEDDTQTLKTASSLMANILQRLARADTLDTIRGYEGEAARAYFQVFNQMIRKQQDDFILKGRTRRPPLDKVNALLSFLYAVLLHDCIAALTAAGLDPNVGFLHADRPGKPSLALDLMEEFRPLLADRLVLSLINRRQVASKNFLIRDGGAVEMNDDTRRTIISAWQTRKQEIVTHPLLEQKARIALLPFLQAKLLARHIRGDLPDYAPCVLK